MEGGAEKAGEEGVKLRGVRLRVGRGRLMGKLAASWPSSLGGFLFLYWGTLRKVWRGRARLNSQLSERMWDRREHEDEVNIFCSGSYLSPLRINRTVWSKPPQPRRCEPA